MSGPQDDKGRIYDIEMQTTNKHDLEERMQYYAAGLNNFTLKSGNLTLSLNLLTLCFSVRMIHLIRVKACMNSISLIARPRL